MKDILEPSFQYKESTNFKMCLLNDMEIENIDMIEQKDGLLNLL